jgi:hypothetical protein
MPRRLQRVFHEVFGILDAGPFIVDSDNASNPGPNSDMHAKREYTEPHPHIFITAKRRHTSSTFSRLLKAEIRK